MAKVEFVSYTGTYPTLCMGVLTLKIDGKEYKFGHEFDSYDSNNHRYRDDNLPRFWKSGGFITGSSRHLIAVEDDWELSVDEELPEDIDKLLPELLEVFNDNVERGCCGGCI